MVVECFLWIRFWAHGLPEPSHEKVRRRSCAVEVDCEFIHFGRSHPPYPHGYESKFSQVTAGFSLWFHLLGFHFGYLFLTHNHTGIAASTFTLVFYNKVAHLTPCSSAGGANFGPHGSNQTGQVQGISSGIFMHCGGLSWILHTQSHPLSPFVWPVPG